MTMKIVQAVDYESNYAYSRGSVSAVINLENINSAVLIPPENTRSVFDNITRLYFRDGSHLDVFGKPEDFAG
jgi:hypothetical protein